MAMDSSVVAFVTMMLKQQQEFNMRLFRRQRKRLEEKYLRRVKQRHRSADVTPLLLSMMLGKEKRMWMKERPTEWWDETVMQHFSDEDWIENFRLSRSSFNKLCDILKDEMKPNENFVREPLPLEKRIAVAVYKLANGCDYLTVANLFGVHKATVHKCIYKFCDTLTAKCKEYINMPSEDESKCIAERFHQNFGFPQVMGVIDCLHIPISAACDSHQDYVNSKGWTSIVLQAVADDQYLFRDCSCKMPGSALDAVVFQESNIYKQAHLLPKSTVSMENVEVPLLLLGDSAYPLLTWLMKEYTGAYVNPEQEYYNAYLSSARNVIDVAFVRLKSRWRILQKRVDIAYQFAPTVIIACCILHNFCESNKEVFHERWMENIESGTFLHPQPSSTANNQSDMHAQTIQEAIKSHIWINFLRSEFS